MHFVRLAASAAFCALYAAPLAAQREPAPPHTPRAAKKNDFADFQVMGWLALEPQESSLIRDPHARPKMDLAAHPDDDTTIIVYDKKKHPDLRARDPGGYEPASNAASLPSDIHYLPPGHCANGAYNTVAGQPANGQDLIGFLGSGDGC